MPRLDPFIDRLFSESARELTLGSGAGAVLAAARGAVPLIRQSLTLQQVVGAVGEIVPDDLRAGFPRAGLTVFPYAAPSGAVEVRLDVQDGRARVVVVPRTGQPETTPADGFALPGLPAGPRAPRAAAQAPPPSAAAPSAAAPTPTPTPAPRAATPGVPLRAGGDARGALDQLLEAMLARRASDLHLSSDRKGIGAVLRQIPNEILTAEKMGVPQAVLDLCHLTKGLVLVTGPTGSGKSTTLAALVDFVNRNRDGRDRPPRLRDLAHEHRPFDGGPDHRPVPRRPAGADPDDAVRVAEGRHLADALQADRGRPRPCPGDPALHERRLEPHPRGEDVPDPFGDADRPRAGDADAQRRAPRPREEEARRAARGLPEIGRPVRHEGRARAARNEDRARGRVAPSSSHLGGVRGRTKSAYA